MSASARQIANAEKLVNAGVVERDDSDNNKFFIVGKAYEITDRQDGSYYCTCQGWLMCRGKATEKTCKHCDAVKISKKKNN